MTVRKAHVLGLAVMAIALIAGQARAADYPKGPITLIVPFSAGGGAQASL